MASPCALVEAWNWTEPPRGAPRRCRGCRAARVGRRVLARPGGVAWRGGVAVGVRGGASDAESLAAAAPPGGMDGEKGAEFYCVCECEFV